VVEAEIFHHFGSPVTADPFSPAKPFFLVLSVRRCKFRLFVPLVENLLHAVIDGSPKSFRVVHLDDRVFRFSVVSHQVGFFTFTIFGLLNAMISRFSSTYGMGVAPIIKLNIVIGVLSKLLNGWRSPSENRYVSLVPIPFPLMLIVFLLQAPNPWSFQIQICHLI
jgi:hypothetical protein